MKKEDGRKKNGGARKGSGRKPLLEKQVLEEIKARMKSHGATEIDVKRKDGTTERLTRAEALLDILFVEGFNNKNITAIKEYFDRIIGKAVQPLEGVKDGEPLVVDFLGEGLKRTK